MSLLTVLYTYVFNRNVPMWEAERSRAFVCGDFDPSD